MGIKNLISLLIIIFSVILSAQEIRFIPEAPEQSFLDYTTVQSADSSIRKEYRYSFKAGRVIVETAAGLAAGSIGGIAGGFIGARLTQNGSGDLSGLVGFFIGGYTGFLIGTAGGVTLVSHNYNSDATILVPFLASLGGGVTGILLADWDGKGNWSQSLPFILPLVSSIVFAEIIYPSRIEITLDHNPSTLNKPSTELRIGLSVPLN